MIYIFHDTSSVSALVDILNGGELLSSALTGAAKHGQGSGEYDSNNFVYLSATDMLFDLAIYHTITLYFDPAALRDRKFSLSNYHVPVAPHRAVEFPDTRTLLPRTQYIRVYARGFAGRDAALSALVRESKAAFPPRGEGFQIPNQVAVRNRLDINGWLLGICFEEEFVRANGLESFVEHVVRALPDIPVRVSARPKRAWADSVYSFYKRDGRVRIGRATK